MTRYRTTRRGLRAGFLAATSIVLWFLIVDAIAGTPLRTPDFLAQIAFPIDDREASLGLILVYTLLHYTVFLTLGPIVARLTTRLNSRTFLPVGLITGFFLFDLIFYGSILTTGVNVLDALGWPVVLVGNLIGGTVLLEYLRRSAPSRGPGWRYLLHEYPVMRKGIVAGLVGASAVAITLFIVDVIFRQPLFTPATLGSAILLGATSDPEIVLSAATIAGYTAIHLLAFTIIGIVAAHLLARVEEYPGLILGFILLLVISETLFIGIATIFAAWVLDTIGWWNVLIGNLTAALTMIAYLAYTHPAILRLLRKGPLPAAQ